MGSAAYSEACAISDGTVVNQQLARRWPLAVRHDSSLKNYEWNHICKTSLDREWNNHQQLVQKNTMYTLEKKIKSHRPGTSNPFKNVPKNHARCSIKMVKTPLMPGTIHPSLCWFNQGSEGDPESQSVWVCIRSCVSILIGMHVCVHARNSCN